MKEMRSFLSTRIAFLWLSMLPLLMSVPQRPLTLLSSSTIDLANEGRFTGGTMYQMDRSSLDTLSCSFADYQTMLSLAYSGNDLFLHASKSLKDCFWFYTLRTGLVNMIQSIGAINALILQSPNELLIRASEKNDKENESNGNGKNDNQISLLSFTSSELNDSPYWKQWMDILKKVRNVNVIIKSFILETGDRITYLPHTYLLYNKKWARDAFLGYLFKKSIDGGINSFKNNERLIAQIILDNIHDQDTLEKILICLADTTADRAGNSNNNKNNSLGNEEKDLNGIIAYVLIVATQLGKLEMVTLALQEALEGLSDPDLENKINAVITITKSRYKLPGASELSVLKNYEIKAFNGDRATMNKDHLLYLEPLNYVAIGRKIFKQDGVIISESGRSLQIETNGSKITIAIDHLGKISVKEEKQNENSKPSPLLAGKETEIKRQDYTIAIEKDNGSYPSVQDGLQLSANDFLMIAKDYRARELFDRWKMVEWPQRAILADMLPHVHIFRVKIKKN